MNRTLLVALIVVATATFVVGVALERNEGDTHHDEATASAATESGEPGEEHAEEPGGETAHDSGEATGESDANILGIDLESTPFVILAALGSLALALAVWLRPRWVSRLAVVAVAMAVFAALDAREVVHQLNENRDGLAALAGVVAALHLAAAAVAAVLGRRAEAATS